MIEKKINNNHGVSLVEVMLYLVIGLIVIGYALNAMTAVAKGYVRERSVTGMQASGRDAIGVLGREIATMGFKTYLRQGQDPNDASKTVYSTVTENGTYLQDCVFDGSDVDNLNPVKNPHYPQSTEERNASFIFGDGGTSGFGDTLEIFRARMQGVYDVADVERIRYFLRNDTLFRSIQTLQDRVTPTFTDWSNATVISLAENVVALQFKFSANSVDFTENFSNNSVGLKDRRDLVKYVKIQMLIRSNRTQDGSIGNIPSDVGNISNTLLQNLSKDYLYRLYEKTVEVPSNGAGDF